MDVTNVELTNSRFAELVAACRAFAECFAAYSKCDEETRADIQELIAYARGTDVDELERESIFATIAQTLYPSFQGVSSFTHDLWEASSPEELVASQDLDAEDETFAQRLCTVMEEKGMTQEELAEATGVGQPAISMMLSRTCRPQRRTVRKFAQALGVSVGDLWPFCGTTDTTKDSAPEASLVSSLRDRDQTTFVFNVPKQKGRSAAWPESTRQYSSESSTEATTLPGAA